MHRKLALIFIVAVGLLLPAQTYAAPWHGGSHRAWHSYHSQNMHRHRRHHRHGPRHHHTLKW